jgi:hypothetical protein
MDTIMLREPTQRWPVVGRRRKYAGHEQAQREEKAEPIDEPTGIGAQMHVDLLVVLKQRRRSLDHQVTEPAWFHRRHVDPLPAQHVWTECRIKHSPRRGF